MVTRRLLQNRREYIRRAGVIGKVSARFVLDWQAEEGPDPGGVVACKESAERVVLMAAAHHQQIADAHSFEVAMWYGRSFIGKVVEDPVVECELAIGNGDADGSRDEAGAQRIEPMAALGRIRVPPAFGHDLTMAQ